MKSPTPILLCIVILVALATLVSSDSEWTRPDTISCTKIFGGSDTDYCTDGSGESTTYLPHNISTINGVVVVGDNNSLIAAKDDDVYNISEANGANPLTTHINFTGVTDFNSMLFRLVYQGGSGHEIEICLWEYDDNAWECEYGHITDMEDFAFVNVNVYDATDHISDGVVSLRFNHIQNGIQSHDLCLDYVSLIDGFSTVTNSEHDAMTGRDNESNHPWAATKADMENGTWLRTGEGGSNNQSINFSGKTTATQNANLAWEGLTGYRAGDAICNTNYTNSHLCTFHEIKQIMVHQNLTNLNGWTGDAWIATGAAKYSPADTPVNDCNGFTHGSAGSYLGNWWTFDTTDGGKGKAGHCGNSLALACCKNE